MGRHPFALGTLGAALTALLLLTSAGVGQAQGPVDVRCVGFEPGGQRKALLHLHNAAAADAPVQVQWLSPDGTIRETEDFAVPSGTTVDQVRRGDAIGVTARIATSGERLVLDAEMVYDDQTDELHRRTVSCARVQ